MILTQNYGFRQIWSQNYAVFTNFDTQPIDYINFELVNCNLKLDPKFQIWADLVPHSKYNLIFMKFGILSRENTLIVNIVFRTDDLVPNVCPTIKVLSNFTKFGTKDKWNILIDIPCLDSGQISF